MNGCRRSFPRRPAAIAAALTGALAVLAGMPTASSADPSLSQLNSELDRQQNRQQQLETSVTGLSNVIGSLSGQIALVQSREATVQSEVAQDRSTLLVTQAALLREQHLLGVLRTRLARGRTLLARQLISNYEAGNPDLVGVVLESNGFNDLLERVAYLRDAERQQQRIIVVTRVAKTKADAAEHRLAELETTDRRVTYDAAVRAQALAGMNSLLQSKQSALKNVEAVKQAALTNTRARAGRLRSRIAQIQAAQAAQRAAAEQAARAAAQSSQQVSAGPSAPGKSTSAVPSGGWAIPYAIVVCESGGQNLPPNGAGASGYYQIVPGTWKMFGGTGPAAYLTSKAEQDAVASRIWRGGAGASNWACAAMVGIH